MKTASLPVDLSIHVLPWAPGTGRMSHAQGLEQGRGQPATAPWSAAAGKPGPVPETAGAQHPAQVLLIVPVPGAALCRARRDPRGGWHSSVQAQGTISFLASLLETGLRRMCSLWVAHMLFEHSLCQSSLQLDSQGCLCLPNLFCRAFAPFSAQN